ncbi:MAG TPA: cytochrome b N-terminal domain-containing protein [Acidimicrobiia bacterium]|nr:cytochrome b N-terminal domain-containing protein [Acidimicrobiia bacterium]
MRKLLVALSATFVVLVATGIYQAFRYFPGKASVASTLHRWSAYLLLALLVATAFVHATRALGARGRTMANLALAVVSVAAIAGVVTGPMLQWDQLALWAVTVGREHLDGVFWSDSVKYILRGSHEVGLSEFRRNVWLHVLVFPLVTVGGIGVLWYACTRSAPAAQPETEPENEEITA